MRCAGEVVCGAVETVVVRTWLALPVNWFSADISFGCEYADAKASDFYLKVTMQKDLGNA
jgi:hypothetical protein